MAEIQQYRGLEAIGKRIGRHPNTIIRLIKEDGFLAYKQHTGIGWRRVWVTDDRLIELWQISKCKVAQMGLGNRIRIGKKDRPEPEEENGLHDRG